jgi:hypothetical protein
MNVCLFEGKIFLNSVERQDERQQLLNAKLPHLKAQNSTKPKIHNISAIFNLHVAERML